MPSSSSRLRVGTRGSALALKQTGMATAALVEVGAAEGMDLEIEVVTIHTTGDKVTDKPFEAIGPKGVFAAELQRALVDNRIDVAVHSLKDLPSTEPDGLVLAAVLERGDARDVLVSGGNRSLAELPEGAVVGTSSSRRRAQLAIHRPDLRTAPLRGNVDTRLRKVDQGEVDAAVLAGVGLVRLGRSDAIAEWLDPQRFVPPPGQGAIVIEARTDRFGDELAWICGAEHHPTRAAVDAERAFMYSVEGGCEVPLGAWARLEGDELVCVGFVSDGNDYVQDELRGSNPDVLGRALARRLLDAGAADLVGRARNS